MKKTKRLNLTLSQALIHYGFVLFLLFIAGLSSKSLVEIYITDTYTGFRTGANLLTSAIAFLLLAILFAQIQYRRLGFKEFVVIYTDEQFQEAVQRTTKGLGWRVENNSKTFFRAYRPWNWTGIRGEMLTIIKDNDKFLINSICDPDNWSSIATYGMNRKNIKIFLKNLEDTLNNIPEKPRLEAVNIENEWSTKNILIRIFTYPLSVFFILIGIYMIL